MTTAIEILGQACMLGELLGTGGMGRVYAVQHPTEPCIAVKLLHAALAKDPAMAGRIVGEAHAARRVSHRNVVRVLDSGETAAGEPFVAMEYVRGTSLGALIRRRGPLPLEWIRSIAAQLLAGLAAIHRAGLVHADMKCDNVLVEETAAGPHVTIIDLGLARPAAAGAIYVGDRMVSGTPEYMAPEQIRGEPLTAATDLYAVGVMLYKMLTGVTPFGGGNTMMVMERHLTDDVVPPSQRARGRAIPAALEHAILCALEKDPDARHLDATLFAAAVDRAVPAGCPERVARGSAVHSIPALPLLRFAEGTAPHDSPGGPLELGDADGSTIASLPPAPGRDRG